ncbi:hypothetical protein ACIGW4_34730 [Streptomyces sp. NPDC053513]|uniref:hypothetical protein n=1 Tax=unclassified Streptomyces TaxID=2593676 RepID=UPI0037D94FB8
MNVLKLNARKAKEHKARGRTMRSGSRIALGAAALAAAATATLAPSAASAAPATATEGACTAWRIIQVDHNAAGVKYRECDRYSGLNTQTKAQLYIWDNRHDGKVAQVYTATGSDLNGRWYQSWDKYYAWGNESHHSPLVDTGWHKGHDVKVLLKAVRG